MAVKHRVEQEREVGMKDAECSGADKRKAVEWKKPVLEDVSGKVMAQPYIRFT